MMPLTAAPATYPTVMQAFSAVISISCGLGAEFCPSSSCGSSTSISKWRRTSWPPIV
jgi:hypothetical protein